MTAILFLATLLCATAASRRAVAAASATSQTGLIDCDIGKVALFDDATSKDGRYAIGWTIRALTKDAKPVDWSLWIPDDANYAMHNNYLADENAPYELINCVVDIRKKKIVKIPSNDSFDPGQIRHSLNAYWSPNAGLPVYALVEYESRFETDSLWLIKIDKSETTQVNIVKQLDQAVQKLLPTKMPLNAAQFAISFPRSDWDDDYSRPVFHADSVDIPFIADLPKSSFDQVSGVVSVHLPAGTVLKVSSNTQRDDPFDDYPSLAKADRELNAIYATLRQQLEPARRSALQKEQRAWMEKRDSDAGVEKYPIAGDEVDPPVVRHDRNDSLLKSTLLRIKELKKRVGSSAPNANHL